MLSTREILISRHQDLSLCTTRARVLERLTQEGRVYLSIPKCQAENFQKLNRPSIERRIRLWQRVGPLVGLQGVPRNGRTGEFFSVFRMSNVPTPGALSTYLATRHVIGSPVELVTMSWKELEFMLHVSTIGYWWLEVPILII